MKYIFLSLIIILTTAASCFSQNSIDAIVNKRISDSINTLPGDSIKFIITNSTARNYADTLQCLPSTTYMYDIKVIYRDVVTGQIFDGCKTVTIQRSNGGAYFVVDDLPITGTILKINWQIVQVNGYIIVAIIPPNANKSKWALSKFVALAAPQ